MEQPGGWSCCPRAPCVGLCVHLLKFLGVCPAPSPPVVSQRVPGFREKDGAAAPRSTASRGGTGSRQHRTGNGLFSRDQSRPRRTSAEGVALAWLPWCHQGQMSHFPFSTESRFLREESTSRWRAVSMGPRARARRPPLTFRTRKPLELLDLLSGSVSSPVPASCVWLPAHICLPPSLSVCAGPGCCPGARRDLGRKGPRSEPSRGPGVMAGCAVSVDTGRDHRGNAGSQ